MGYIAQNATREFKGDEMKYAVIGKTKYSAATSDIEEAKIVLECPPYPEEQAVIVDWSKFKRACKSGKYKSYYEAAQASAPNGWSA